jgi:uncharacterized protein YneF (UPF0154 family)
MLIIGGMNNRYQRAGLFALNPLDLSGISPPYDCELFLSSGMPRGSQLFYVAFPETELSSVRNDIRNSVTKITYDALTQSYFIAVAEGFGLAIGSNTYILNKDFIPELNSFPDVSYGRYESLLMQSGKQPSLSEEEILNQLLPDIVVYHGDSIVHHISAGINFSK